MPFSVWVYGWAHGCQEMTHSSHEAEKMEYEGWRTRVSQEWLEVWASDIWGY